MTNVGFALRERVGAKKATSLESSPNTVLLEHRHVLFKTQLFVGLLGQRENDGGTGFQDRNHAV